MTKTCHRCKEVKEINEFYIHDARLGRRKASCKSCSHIQKKEQHVRNPNIRRAWRKRDAINKTKARNQGNVIIPDRKSCSRCLEDQPIDNFGKCDQSFDGHNYECKKCRIEISNNHRLTQDHSEYDLKLKAQGGVCAICSRPETSKRQSGKVKLLAKDHDHSTGFMRGLLCIRCNTGLGLFRDDPSLLVEAVDYLATHSENNVIRKTA